MSDQKSNTPIIIGVVALLAVLGGGAFLASKNMTKDEPIVASTEAASPAAGETTAAASNSGETPATAEETAEVEKVAAAAGAFDGVTAKPGNPVIAKVDGRDISRVDVFRYIKMLPQNIQQLPPNAIYPMAVEQVINTRIVQNKAEEAGLENDPEVQEQVNMAKQQIVRSVYVQREVDKNISDSDLKNKYDAEIGKVPAIEEINASHILVKTEDEAKALIKKLDDGADFAKLAAENSADDSNKDKGGELGWFTQKDMVPEFADAAFKLSKGSVTQTPIKTQFGYHVVKVLDKRERPKPSFAEVKPMLQVEARREKLESMLADWRKTAKVESFDINGDAVKPQPEIAPAAGDTTPAPKVAE